MTLYQYTGSFSVYYPSLGVTVNTSDIFDFGVSTPPADGRWSVNAGPATRTFGSVTPGAGGTAILAPTNGQALTWSVAAGQYVPVSPYSGSQVAGDVLSIDGTSYDVTPGIRCTSGNEWFNRLKSQLGFLSTGVYGQSGRWSVHNAFAALGTSAGGGPAGGWPAFPSGSVAATGNRGVCVVNTYTNDAANMLDLTAITSSPITTPDLVARTQALSTLLAVRSSSSRSEMESGATYAGTAWASLTNTVYSNGTLIYSTTAGDWVQKTVTIPAAGYVYVVVNACDPATGTAAAVTPSIDGVAQATVSSAALTIRGFKEAGGTFLWYSPAVIKVTGSPGSHTLRLTHAGTTGQYLLVDTVLSPAAVPPLMLVVQDPVPSSSATSPTWNAAQVATMTANRAAYEAAVLPVVASFGATWVQTSLSAANGDLSYVDGLHPNDRGMRKRADEVKNAVLSSLAGSDPDSLYTTL